MSSRRHLTHTLIVGAVIVLALAAFGVPIVRALPYALFLACPLMMIFMMRGMDHGAHAEHQARGEAPIPTTTHEGHDRHPLTQTTITASDDNLRQIDEQYRR